MNRGNGWLVGLVIVSLGGLANAAYVKIKKSSNQIITHHEKESKASRPVKRERTVMRRLGIGAESFLQALLQGKQPERPDFKSIVKESGYVGATKNIDRLIEALNINLDDFEEAMQELQPTDRSSREIYAKPPERGDFIIHKLILKQSLQEKLEKIWLAIQGVSRAK